MFKFESTVTELQTDQEYPTVVFTLQDETSLYSMVEAFEAFLRASGYSFDGHLAIIDNNSSDLDQLEKDFIKDNVGDKSNPDPLDETFEDKDAAYYKWQETNDQTAGDNKGFDEKI